MERRRPFARDGTTITKLLFAYRGRVGGGGGGLFLEYQYSGDFFFLLFIAKHLAFISRDKSLALVVYRLISQREIE